MTKRGGIEYAQPSALGYPTLAEVIARAGAHARKSALDWNEEDHPRAPDGKFGDSGSGHDAEHTYTAGKAGAEDASTGKPVDVSKDVNSGVKLDDQHDSPFQGTYSVNHGYYGSTQTDGKGKTESWQLLPKDGGKSQNVVGPRWAVELGAEKAQANRIWGDREQINKALTETLGKQGALNGQRLGVSYSDDKTTFTLRNYDKSPGPSKDGVPGKDNVIVENYPTSRASAASALSAELEYNPDQPRDASGKWGSGDSAPSPSSTGGPPGPGSHDGGTVAPSERVQEVIDTYAQSKDVTWGKPEGDTQFAQARDAQGNVVATVEDTGQGFDWTTSTRDDAPVGHGVEAGSLESAQRQAENNLDREYMTNLRVAQETDRAYAEQARHDQSLAYDQAVARATAGQDQSNVMRGVAADHYVTTDENGVQHPGTLSGGNAMWKIEQRGRRWAVTLGAVTDSASWFSAASAQMHADRLNAGRMLQRANAELAADDGPLGGAWYAVLCVDGYESADGRVFDNFDWASLPLPLMALSENQGGGHWGAESAGTIETIEKLSDGRRVMASGHYSATDNGTETETQVASRALRFVSVDPADYDVEEEITKMTSTGIPLDARWRFTNYTIGGATICPFPAIRLAVIWNEGMDAPDELTEALPDPVGRSEPEIVEVGEDFMPMFMLADGENAAKLPVEATILADDPEAIALLASSAPARAAACELTRNCGGPALPPAAWFDDPGLSGPTPLSVDAEGRVAGHIALWSTPHRGFLDYQWSDRIFAPREPDYSQFAHRPLPVACCADAGCGHARQTRKTGALVMATTHANGRLSPEQAARHYENTGYAIGDVAAGADDYGIWVAGALRPDVEDRRVREFLGSAPSGDWRMYDGQLRLTAVLCVNSEGFPIIASSAHYEDYEVTALWRGFGTVTSPLEPDALVASVHARREERRLQPLVGEVDLSDRYVTRDEFDRMAAQLAVLEPVTLEQLDSLIQADA